MSACQTLTPKKVYLLNIDEADCSHPKGEEHYDAPKCDYLKAFDKSLSTDKSNDKSDKSITLNEEEFILKYNYTLSKSSYYFDDQIDLYSYKNGETTISVEYVKNTETITELHLVNYDFFISENPLETKEEIEQAARDFIIQYIEIDDSWQFELIDSLESEDENQTYFNCRLTRQIDGIDTFDAIDLSLLSNGSLSSISYMPAESLNKYLNYEIDEEKYRESLDKKLDEIYYETNCTAYEISEPIFIIKDKKPYIAYSVRLDASPGSDNCGYFADFVVSL